MLHELSRRASVSLGGAVTEKTYAEAVTQAFGSQCAYCSKLLEHDRVVIEHLEGMNRFRLGLHLPGNVALSCMQCNREKRRDDQQEESHLADTGWAAFLAHNGTRCPSGCKTCDYWNKVWPEPEQKLLRLLEAHQRIEAFRTPFFRFTDWIVRAKPLIRQEVERMYRECQNFATQSIDDAVSRLPVSF